MTRNTLGSGGLLGSDPSDDEAPTMQASDSLVQRGRNTTQRNTQRGTGQAGTTGATGSVTRTARPGVPGGSRRSQV